MSAGDDYPLLAAMRHRAGCEEINQALDELDRLRKENYRLRSFIGTHGGDAAIAALALENRAEIEAYWATCKKTRWCTATEHEADCPKRKLP